MKNLLRATIPILSSVFIFGCGGGGGGQDTSSPSQVDNGTATTVPTPSAPTAGDGNESGDLPGTEASGLVAMSGAAVKGPLVFAMVTAYQIDGSASDLKGDPVAVGMTDQNAALQLNIPEILISDGPFLLEYTEGKELDGANPAIPVLTTLITEEQLLAGTPVYATPITSFIIQHAHILADRVDNSKKLSRPATV